jgi:HrpA-like RNA helicase
VWRVAAGMYDEHLESTSTPTEDASARASAILVFLPGLAEIQTLYDALQVRSRACACDEMLAACVHNIGERRATQATGRRRARARTTLVGC